MKSISLMYHDVVSSEQEISCSGFDSPDANHYKVDASVFSSHLEQIYADSKYISTINSKLSAKETPIFLTFDDGGKSAISLARDVLNKFNAKGHFFITTSMIGTPNFLTEEDIIKLDQEGHIIGSHSHTHPVKISALNKSEIELEWKSSTDILERILKKKITVASIPGGFFSNEVVESASKAGIRTLFTSEPKRKFSKLSGCTLIGRYAVLRRTPFKEIEHIYKENTLYLIKQFLFWEFKKVLKKLFGPQYAFIRKKILK